MTCLPVLSFRLLFSLGPGRRKQVRQLADELYSQFSLGPSGYVRVHRALGQARSYKPTRSLLAEWWLLETSGTSARLFEVVKQVATQLSSCRNNV